MSEFKNEVKTLQNFDPFKRVAYPFGMLLTPAEFLQDQYFFLERDRLHARVLHGYGTICGLKVTIQDNDHVSVSPGLAIDTAGRLIRVESDKCASLKDWVKANTETASPPVSTFSVYVVLCYKECPSDKTLIRTSPCQPKEQSEAYSRVLESSELKFVMTPPAQDEEQRIREFEELLAAIPVSHGLPAVDLEEYKVKIADLVRGLQTQESPPAFTSPPAAPLDAVNEEDAKSLFRHAFKVWVTEVKPKLVAGACVNLPDQHDCVLLAELKIDESGKVLINEQDRPILLSTRLIQEHSIVRSGGMASSVVSHHSLAGLDLDDHPQYLTQGEGDSLYSAANHVHPDTLTLAQAKKAFVQMQNANQPYTVVAAGRFEGDGSQIGPVLNNLKATPVQGFGNRVFKLDFQGYKNPNVPNSTHSYVVKGTGENQASSVRVTQFLNDGIEVRVTARALAATGFMVEISRIGNVMTS